MPLLNVVSVVVANMGASIDFYSRLGLTLAGGDAADDHASFSGEGVELMLDTEELVTRLDAGWTRPSGGHAIALAFRCGSVAEVDATFAALVEVGAPASQEPWDAFWGQRYATVLDPDGNPVDLYCPL